MRAVLAALDPAEIEHPIAGIPGLALVCRRARTLAPGASTGSAPSDPT